MPLNSPKVKKVHVPMKVEFALSGVTSCVKELWVLQGSRNHTGPINVSATINFDFA